MQVKKMTVYELLNNYPVPDKKKPYYVLTPVIKKNNKWVGVEVVIDGDGGYISPEDNFLKTEYDNYDECKKACDIANEFVGFTSKQINAVLSISMQKTTIDDYKKS